jgi:hypothetical protein
MLATGPHHGSSSGEQSVCRFAHACERGSLILETRSEYDQEDLSMAVD